MAAKVIYQCAVSLDGFIEDHEGKFDWCMTDVEVDVGMEDFVASLEAILYGRSTYELMLRMGQSFDAGIQHFVFASHLPEVAPNCLWVKEKADIFVRELKSKCTKNIWLFGGASLAGSLAEAGLVDEIQLAVHPIVLGRGMPLFKGLLRRLPYFPVETKSYENGLVMMTYALKE